jgi:tRNA threonylcarbamoyladenosine biosynthesis protein TsaE
MQRQSDDQIIVFLPDQTATEALAQHLAPHVLPGDMLLLSGEIGAGKSCFARAFIRSRLGQMVDVPSPTYTLVQTYDSDVISICHADLYRLSHADELHELGLLDAPQAICLIEWPERGSALWPETALHLTFTPQYEGRNLRATGHPRLLAALRAAAHG